MSFDEILDRLWFFDSEVFAHDTLWVFKKYRTHEEYWVHNPLADELDTFIQRENPILCGYNCNAYDKFILQACLLGYTPEEVKKYLSNQREIDMNRTRKEDKIILHETPSVDTSLVEQAERACCGF